MTRKITRSLARIVLGLGEKLFLGNLDSLRDWGHAKDYVEMQWLMLQQDKAEDFVIATGRQFSVRDFVNVAGAELGLTFNWEGQGVNETGTIATMDYNKLVEASGRHDVDCKVKVGDTIVFVDPRYFRPTEVETLLGDPSKAKEKLGWTPKITFEEMVSEMVKHDLHLAQRDAVIKVAGFKAFSHEEE